MENKGTLRSEILRKQQEVFDVTVEKLAIQGCRAFNGKRCMFRTPDGKKCAVGMWISDEAYVPTMEGGGYGWLRQFYASVLPSILLDDDLVEVFQPLQRVHDDARTWESTETFRAMFGAEAQRLGLNTHRLDQLVLMTPVVTETTE